MPAGPNHSGAALIPSTIVGEAVGREQRPFTAATVGSSYGLESETMTIHRAYSTSAEATPSSASELRLAKPQTGLTSITMLGGTCSSSLSNHYSAGCTAENAEITLY